LARFATPRQRLVALVRTIVAYFDEHPHLLDLIQRAEVMHGSGQNFPWREARDQLIHLALDLFEQADARGDFTVRDPNLAALMLLGGLRGVIRFGHRPRPRDLGERVVAAFLQGYDQENATRAEEPGAPVSAASRPR
jgi:hypothetical protein